MMNKQDLKDLAIGIFGAIFIVVAFLAVLSAVVAIPTYAIIEIINAIKK